MSGQSNPYESDYLPSPSTAAPKKPNKQEAIPQVNFDVKGTYGTPAALLDNLEKMESSGEATAINKQTKALGSYQFLPETAKHLHDIGVKFNPFDKAESRAAADYYLSILAAKNKGDWNKALAAYGGFKTEDPSGYIASVTKGVDFGKNAAPVSAAAVPAAPAAENQYAGDYGDIYGNAQAAARIKRQGPDKKETQKSSVPQSPVNLFGVTSNISPTIDSARAAAEMVTGAPAGSVAALTPATEAASTGSAGFKWLKNWANKVREGFEGGVPEAAQIHNRSKPGGKITSRLYNKFGNRSLNINDWMAEQEAIERAAASAAQAETRTAGAAALSGPLNWLGKAAYGVGGVLGAYDTGARAFNGDTTGAAISGVGTLAQMAAPYVASAVGAGTLGGLALPAVATVAPLYNMARDRNEYLKTHPNETPEDLLRFYDPDATNVLN